ncbi:hypothetical protein TTHERM_000483449 (macronuclear) [Tetrahymena thermophila SB210]|uniref:Uncharacterized protein n=1 Tax=Tetrahymena thermophila (strain SB210) TaxID=312017 RepID=W7X9R3_TETTS|nr:hypothetical protein TTHERM_000483449 [Tetrahymena thermophila SB210]EWS74077.1 hypothetical protein TTHERM_000483449 [Tetrahymena thermophila SB210]|eukprot:XP_012653410.1 hypothetical protein TTHERM_000483449 [Tetrahymena thermophila SB210]
MDNTLQRKQLTVYQKRLTTLIQMLKYYEYLFVAKQKIKQPPIADKDATIPDIFYIYIEIIKEGIQTKAVNHIISLQKI